MKQAGHLETAAGSVESAPAVTRPAGRGFGVADLRLSAFRNYRQAHLRVRADRIVLVGPNGAGKTNLLEALSLLSPGRGLRGAALGEMLPGAHAGPPGGEDTAWAVSARIRIPGHAFAAGETGGHTPAGPGSDLRLGVGLRRLPDGGERRETRIDGEAGRPMAEFAGLLPLLWLTPAMDRLFLDGAGARRRFLDRLVYGFDPGHARRVAAFEQTMRERNRLLKSGRVDARWFAAVEGRMAAQAVAVAAARLDGCARLGAALARASGPFPRALVALDGLVENWLAEAPALAVEDRYREHLAAARPVDAQAGLTRAGPHRSDLVVRQAETGAPAAACSTGQQKALVIAIVLANARMVRDVHGWGPVLLLDEVVAHLDGARRDALFAALSVPGMQTWMSGTDAALFDGLDGDVQTLRVQEGIIADAGDGIVASE